MAARKQLPSRTETAILTKSKRRCCLCFHLNQDYGEKLGQVAHLDGNPENDIEDNLAYLCFDHHSLFDSTTRQHKNYTTTEVKAAREDLCSRNGTLDSDRAVQWIIVLDGVVAEFNKPRVEAIAARLQELLQDPQLTITRIQRGSVRVTVESGAGAFRLIKSLFDEGRVPDILGHRIRSIQTVADVYHPIERAMVADNPNLRQAAATAVGELGLATREAFQALVAVLRQDVESKVRCAAARSLGVLGPDAEAVAALVDALRDESSDVRAAASAALGKSSSIDPRLVDSILSMLADDAGIVRNAAAESLGALAFVDPTLFRKSAKRYFIANVSGPFVRSGFERIGPATIPVLVDCLAEETVEIRRMAAQSLGSVGVTDESTIHPLVRALADASSTVRQAAARSLGACGSHDKEALAALTDAAKDVDTRVCLSAVEALGRSTIPDARALHAITDLMKGAPDSQVRLSAVEAVSQICARLEPDGADQEFVKQALASLADALEDKDSAVAQSSLGALLRIGQPAIDALASRLKHLNSQTRLAAANALGEFGPLAIDTVPLLRNALGDDDKLVQSAARMALGRIDRSPGIAPRASRV
jgi:HEAT repeat protein